LADFLAEWDQADLPDPTSGDWQSRASELLAECQKASGELPQFISNCIQYLTTMKPRSNFQRVSHSLKLLVIIAVVAILAGNVFPGSNQAQAKVKATTCIHNLRQIDWACACIPTTRPIKRHALREQLARRLSIGQVTKVC